MIYIKQRPNPYATIYENMKIFTCSLTVVVYNLVRNIGELSLISDFVK